jgi:hypothetical protein
MPSSIFIETNKLVWRRLGWRSREILAVVVE